MEDPKPKPLPDNLRDLATLILDVIARMPAPAGEPPVQQEVPA